MGVDEHPCRDPVPFAQATVWSWKYAHAAGSAWQGGCGNTDFWEPITYLSPVWSWRQSKPEGAAETQPGHPCECPRSLRREQQEVFGLQESLIHLSLFIEYVLCVPQTVARFLLSWKLFLRRGEIQTH